MRCLPLLAAASGARQPSRIAPCLQPPNSNLLSIALLNRRSSTSGSGTTTRPTAPIDASSFLLFPVSHLSTAGHLLSPQRPGPPGVPAGGAGGGRPAHPVGLGSLGACVARCRCHGRARPAALPAELGPTPLLPACAGSRSTGGSSWWRACTPTAATWPRSKSCESSKMCVARLAPVAALAGHSSSVLACLRRQPFSSPPLPFPCPPHPAPHPPLACLAALPLPPGGGRVHVAGSAGPHRARRRRARGLRRRRCRDCGRLAG